MWLNLAHDRHLIHVDRGGAIGMTSAFFFFFVHLTLHGRILIFPLVRFSVLFFGFGVEEIPLFSLRKTSSASEMTDTGATR